MRTDKTAPQENSNETAMATETNNSGKISRIQYRRKHGQAGQSAIIAVIVLFLLLILATIFIAIVARNISNTRNAANTSASRRFADAGLNYVDKQLMESPEGADWRPLPDSQVNDPQDVDADGNFTTVDVNGNGIRNTEVSQMDPDYRYLQLYKHTTGEGGFTRVNFGAESGGGQDSSGSVGGRALVRVTYQPNTTDPLSRYIKLEAIGRVGQINTLDPTTYQNTEGISQRVELAAYKGIGLNEYARYITNRDNKPISVALGAPLQVRDRGVLRNIPTFINGAVRINAGVTFYGQNFISLNPYRGDALEVSGPISLNNVSDTAGKVSANDPSSVYISTPILGANDINLNNAAPNLLPSGSSAFTTLGPILSAKTNTAGSPLNGLGLVRDNPRGSETEVLAPELDQYRNSYQNLRSTPRLAPPTIDAATSSGLTRYRQLTRESAPLDPDQVTANRIDSLGGDAGALGWGQGLYIPNTNDTQATSPNLLSSYSARSDWLNPSRGEAPSNKSYWVGDLQYTPPAVTIELSPRSFKITRSPYDNQNSRQAFNFRDPNGGARLRNVETIVRYTQVQPVGGGNGNKPAQALTGILPAQEYQGYPATQVQQGQYEGDLVIYAEGNVRIRGVVGGFDPESGVYFKRHITVVSGGTIYVDGNLLRDNISFNDNNINAKAVQGQSSIALLAKQYIAVNTTQFLNPESLGFATVAPESGAGADAVGSNPEDPTSLLLNVQKPQYLLAPTFAPILTATGFATPSYVTGANSTIGPSLFIRHRTQGPTGASITVGLNRPNPLTNPNLYNYLDFTPYNANVPGDGRDLALNQFENNGNAQPSGVYLDERFDLNSNTTAINAAAVSAENLLQIKNDPVPGYESGYQVSRVGVVPLDIRIEAMMYAQEGSFFIIPGPWFNANPNDSYEHLSSPDSLDGAPFGRRYGEVVQINPDGSTNARLRVNPRYPFYQEPMDVRITFCGSITENLPAEIADQGAWLQKWGWVPDYYGSTGLTDQQHLRGGYPSPGQSVATMHGRQATTYGTNGLPGPNNAGNGIVYEYDDRAILPYAPTYSANNGQVSYGGTPTPRPLRTNPYNPYQPLPFAPRLPVSPGFLYYGQPTQQ